MALSTLGIDVAKATLAVVLLHATRTYRKEFATTASGHASLLAWIAHHTSGQPVHAAMEATGVYGEAIALALHQAGHTVSVVNPAHIAAYAQSQGTRNKTDAADAALIARYCLKEQPPAWTPPAPEVRELRALVRQRQALVEMRQQEANRLSDRAPPASVRTVLTAHVAFLDAQMVALEQQIDQHIDDHDELRRQRDLMMSIKGLGRRAASDLLGELGDLRSFHNARQLVAYAGLNPREFRSGTSVHRHTRLSKQGNARVRALLSMPALTAIQHNPVVKALRDRLVARGKAKMAAVGAAMRKLLHLMYGVVKHNRAFDPNYAAG
ncbi:MAG: IS110 family transposase [Chloroflexia bacterium]|nr:IS110 family transposase [Chloroflexia bacterium]